MTPRRSMPAWGRQPAGLLLTVLLTVPLALLPLSGVAASLSGAAAALSGATVALPAELERTLDLIGHRAALMPAVADWKQARGRPIADPAREAVVLEAAVAEATRLGFQRAGIRDFFSAQIALARDIQTAHLARADAGTLGTELDLITDLRPAISATGNAMLEQFALVMPLLRQPVFAEPLRAGLRQRLQPLGASDGHIDGLWQALRALRPAPALPADRLERILASGRLRVGTTGDYRPFSYRIAERLTGIDVDLAALLAASLDVELELVATSWPTLMGDLQADAFDIAMSGVSRQPFRARQAEFSDPYHSGGKTPIIRCADAGRFSSLAAIDVAGVRVIVNPGGTNERFTRARIHQAEISVHPDNLGVFEEIAAGRADVMFTDAIEVRLQSALHPALCPALDGDVLSFSEKGWLLPRDGGDAWRRYLNLWLRQIRGDGTLERVMQRHVEAATP